MIAAETATKNKSFWNRYPRWTYWFSALLILEMIIILGVVFGYVIPKNKKIKNSISECGIRYKRELEACGSGYKFYVSRCIKACDTSDIQCANNCYSKYEGHPVICAIDMLIYYQNCVITEDFYWPHGFNK